MSLFKSQPIGCKTGPPGEMDFFNMAKVVRNTPRKNFQNAKRDNTIMKLTKKTKELSISPKEKELGPELKITKWSENLKQQPEDVSSEDELSKIIHKSFTNNSESFQILVDGN
ncbi:hypothetical protein O181_008390 [Austropuccinia psidii MF-1]|uniref:Uncharacterized protein n=1 Tax=Austropuccinia psidii MF-1 TaxID=1389203 RepID=A0A9Q3BPU6_9BASI|nr:hypothetical protein [Austropuccinia psidii MF-1]